MLGESVLYFLDIEWAVVTFKEKHFSTVIGFITADDTLAHWVISQLYLKVSFETKMLLDPGIYFNHADKLAAFDKF